MRETREGESCCGSESGMQITRIYVLDPNLNF